MKILTPTHLKNQSTGQASGGFSLAEVMVAVGVATVLLMATAATFFGNMKSVAQARALTGASIFLETIHEDLLAQPYSNLLALNGNSFFNDDTEKQSRYRADLTVFQATIGILQVRVSLIDTQTNLELGQLVTVRSNA